MGESREWGHLVGMADPRWDDYCLPDELFEHIHEPPQRSSSQSQQQHLSQTTTTRVNHDDPTTTHSQTHSPQPNQNLSQSFLPPGPIHSPDYKNNRSKTTNDSTPKGTMNDSLITTLVGENELLRARLEQAQREAAEFTKRELQMRASFEEQRAADKAARVDEIQQLQSDNAFKDQEIKALSNKMHQLAHPSFHSNTLGQYARASSQCAIDGRLQTPAKRPLETVGNGNTQIRSILSNSNSCKKRYNASSCASRQHVSSPSEHVAPTSQSDLALSSPRRRVSVSFSDDDRNVRKSSTHSSGDGGIDSGFYEVEYAGDYMPEFDRVAQLSDALIPLRLSTAREHILLSTLMAEHGALREVLLRCAEECSDVGMGESTSTGRELSSNLLQAAFVLMGDASHAPLLLHAVEPYLAVKNCLAANADLNFSTSLIRLVCLLLVGSSDCCRAAASGLIIPIQHADHDADYTSLVGKYLFAIVTHLTQCPPGFASDMLLFSLKGVADLVWMEPSTITPCVRAWLLPDLGDDNDAQHENQLAGESGTTVTAQSPVIDKLLDPMYPIAIRFETANILHLLVEDENTFDVLAPATHGHSTALLRLATALSFAYEPRSASESKSTKKYEPLGQVVNTDSTNELDGRHLAGAALRVLSRAVACHEGVSARLISLDLGLALPVRLVSLLLAASHELLPGLARLDRIECLIDLELLRGALLLLLELAKKADLKVELAGGSWISDLVSVTAQLTSSEVHPELQHLGLPAKMLQNAVTVPRRMQSQSPD